MPNLFNRLMPRGHDVHRLRRHDAALLPVARDDPDRPVRAQQRRPAQLLPGPQAEVERAARPGCSAAGYNTAHVGKFLNSYEANDGRSRRGRAGLGPLVHGAREAPLLQLEGLQERPGQALREQRQRSRHERDDGVRDPLDQAAGAQEGSLLHAGRLLRAPHLDRPRHALLDRRRARARGRGPLRDLPGPTAAELQRAGRLRQAVADQGPDRDHPGGGAQHRAPLPLHPRVRLRRRPRSRRDHGHAQGPQGARRHGRHVRLRQRLLLRRAPDREGQAEPLRGEHPRCR